MNITKRVLATAAVVGMTAATFVASTGPAAAATDPVKQAYVAATAKMVPVTKISQTIPLKKAAPRGGSVVFFYNGTPAAQYLADGIKQAASLGGWSFDQITYSPNNTATLQQAMMNALQKKPTAVILSSQDPSTWGPAVTAAYAAAKVPIIAGATCPIQQSGPIFPGAATCAQSVLVGRTLADWFIADSKGTGSMVFQSMPVFNSFVAIRDAFMAEVKSKCKACKVQIVETTLSQAASGQIPTIMVNALRANPGATYLFFDNATWSNGIMPALDAAGLKGRIKVGGAGLDANALSFLKASAQVAWTASNFVVFGYANFDSVLRVVTKSRVSRRTRWSPSAS